MRTRDLVSVALGLHLAMATATIARSEEELREAEDEEESAQSLTVGDGQYTWSLSGVRSYMKQLADRNPPMLYQAVLPSWEAIETKHQRALYTAASLGGASALVLAYSQRSLASAEDSDRLARKTQYGSIAIGLAGAALFTYWLMGPDYHDLGEFRRQHDQAAKRLAEPQMQLSWNQGPAVIISTRFTY